MLETLSGSTACLRLGGSRLGFGATCWRGTRFRDGASKIPRLLISAGENKIQDTTRRRGSANLIQTIARFEMPTCKLPDAFLHPQIAIKTVDGKWSWRAGDRNVSEASPAHGELQ